MTSGRSTWYNAIRHDTGLKRSGVAKDTIPARSGVYGIMPSALRRIEKRRTTVSEAGKYKERIAVLRSMMRERGIDIYIVPTSDYHASEYVGEHFKERAFLTGFTGSAGTAVVTLTEACLWTDGRYFIQAKKQLSGSGIVLQRMGEPGVPQIFEYVQEHLKQKGCIAFDGRCMSYKEAEAYLTLAEKRGGRVQTDEDLVGQIWKDRPELPKNEVFILGEEYAGETSEKKLGRIREKLQQSVGEEDYGHLISCLYDIAWILNLRGNDICHVPVFLSYLYITKDQVILYANSENWSGKVLEYLQRQQVRLRPYAAVYEDLAACMQETVVLDLSSVNLRLCEAAAGQGARNILDIKNPAERMRAVKNQTEIANTLEAHRKDGVAVTKFLYYLKTEMAKGRCLSELDAEQYLYRMRKEQEDFLDVSFDTISAYGANAAMMHYTATPESYATLRPEGFLLVDSGGHYLQGTTDITRTIVLGPLTDQMKRCFTLVLKANLRLAAAHFPLGCCGQNLDVLSRGILWEYGLDYRCGTGHGVGHILNVHEGPNSFRWKIPKGDLPSAILPGMITTDEPGLYVEGEFGIRTENELLCVKDQMTEYGEFLKFEPITYAPIDLDGIDVTLLSAEERQQLNAYHAKVFEVVSPSLSKEEREWLKQVTGPV